MAGLLSVNVFHGSISTLLLPFLAALLPLLSSASVFLEGADLQKGAYLQEQKLQEQLNGQLQAIARQAQNGKVSEPENVDYLLQSLGFFNNFAVKAEYEAEHRSAVAVQQLETAMANTQDENVRLALETSITTNKLYLAETTRMYKGMISFSGAVRQLLTGANSKGHNGCESVICGEHASCTSTTQGVECVCNEGYVGKGGEGRDCHAPPEFMPHRLVAPSVGGSTTRAAEMEVCVFGNDKLAVIYRDTAKRNVGQVVVGYLRQSGAADLSPPVQFTEDDGMAFSPIIMGTAKQRLVLAWRDENRMGSCWVRGAFLGGSGIRGASMAITWGKRINVCRNQAHKMAFVSLPNEHFALLFADKMQESPSVPAVPFGNSLLARIGDQGGVEALGNFRFSDHAVVRLEVAKITPTSFVLAARAAKAVDDLETTAPVKQEATAIYGELLDNDLVFDPNPINLEPKASQMWARGVSLIAPNTVAYAYQDGADMEIKMAILELNRATHRLELVQEPTVVRKGFSPYVSMVSVPYTPSDPHTLIYYEDEISNSSMVNLCSFQPKKKRFEKCEDFPWLTQRLSTVSGVHLGGGRSLLVFAPESGVPYYGVFGLSKK